MSGGKVYKIATDENGNVIIYIFAIGTTIFTVTGLIGAALVLVVVSNKRRKAV
ncbi:MAG: hypothetical protein IJZ94_01700 [Clostridia bacterium]|nr:hypothetical protein [Clostridia bacterium]